MSQSNRVPVNANGYGARRHANMVCTVFCEREPKASYYTVITLFIQFHFIIKRIHLN